MKVGPKYKICRRLGDSVFDKCQTQKFQVARAKKRGSFRGARARTDYGTQLTEKQKVRYTYYVSEKQLSNYAKQAKEKEKTTPANLLHRFLEMRLDNVVYRAGFAPSRPAARQMVSHGHFCVNGRRVTIPSYSVSVDDVITIRKGSAQKPLFNNLRDSLKNAKPASGWLRVDNVKMTITVTGLPDITKREEAGLDFSTVMEFYSRV